MLSSTTVKVCFLSYDERTQRVNCKFLFLSFFPDSSFLWHRNPYMTFQVPSAPRIMHEFSFFVDALSENNVGVSEYVGPEDKSNMSKKATVMNKCDYGSTK